MGNGLEANKRKEEQHDEEECSGQVEMVSCLKLLLILKHYCVCAQVICMR